jgi:protein SCO1
MAAAQSTEPKDAPPPAVGALVVALAQAVGRAVGGRITRMVGKPWFWALSIGLVFAIPILGALRREVPKPPAIKMALPAFNLTDERGQPFGSEDLRGHVWVADFVFTSCPSVCPKLTTRMGEIQHRARNLGDAFHLVTFTVDPENDTPERLAAYARTYHANPRRWTFLTGSLQAIEATVVKGFKQALGKEEVEPGSGLFSIFHGERLVLVDPDLNMRGFYEATDEGITQLLHDAGVIANLRTRGSLIGDPPAAEGSLAR